MPKIQIYTSDDVAEKINAVVEKRRAEGAKEREVSFSSVTTMLVELGLRVYEAQMEKKDSTFNQTLFNKTLLENVIKTQFIVSKLLAMESLSPHLVSNDKFNFQDMAICIREDVDELVATFFPARQDEE